MNKFYIARAEEIKADYNEHGFALTELLEGSHDDSIHNYKGFLKAGAEIVPELYKDKVVIYMFGKGKGYVADQNGVNSIEEEISFTSQHLIKIHTESTLLKIWSLSSQL